MKIEQYLFLNKYFLYLFGVSNTKNLITQFQDSLDGTDIDGKSYFINILRSKFPDSKISEEDLIRYDKNIQSYLIKLNRKREPKVVLKYFQYLALLFSEILLDNLKNNKIKFINELNDFFNEYKRHLSDKVIKIIEPFNENDLKKIAFWMATGSGKTLIMHLNYYQFLHYKLFEPDNIILITPNEGLSKQHYEELVKSSIPAHLYQGNSRGGLLNEGNILVIEITKLVEEKKGGGVSLPVEAFEGKNLVFVDEGHKGKASEEQKWAILRKKISENGFVFEYSATFAQILSESNPEIFSEYTKSIIFDYSYKYFYLDGYGKDFSVLNVKKLQSQDKFFDYMFVANLLSYYEQLKVFEENRQKAEVYKIEKPLWIFVGTTVTGKQIQSDVFKIIQAFHKIFIDKSKKDWFESIVDEILNDKTPLKLHDNSSPFKNFYKFLDKKIDYSDLFIKIFNGKGDFKLFEIKNADGEIGMKVGENDYFGVVNVGNLSELKKNLESLGITVEADSISSSLFDKIKEKDSTINVLIGSKKFIEGWDTWRVSSMGLLNIGKGQGPQIIQLFGRGVRLKGKDYSLKRSGSNEEIKLLERLNIFGMSADYLEKFLMGIEKEEPDYETIQIPLKLNFKKEWGKLYVPYTTPVIENEFNEKKVIELDVDNNLTLVLNLVPQMHLIKAEEKRDKIEQTSIPTYTESYDDKFKNYINYLDINKLYLSLIEFKLEKKLFNVVFCPETLLDVLREVEYKIYLPYELSFNSVNDLSQLEEIALLILKKYLILFRNKHYKIIEKKNVKYVEYSERFLNHFKDAPKKFSYKISISKEKTELINKIKGLSKQINKLIKEENSSLPRLNLDFSLYVPLLLKDENLYKINPDYLIESEEKFLKGLREYLIKVKKNKKENKLLNSFRIYLVRNDSHNGVGFQLDHAKFYPDFILWLKNNKKEIVAFIDPKGLEHSKDLKDEKVIFYKEIKKIEKVLNKKSKKSIELNSIILSITDYYDLIKGYGKDVPSQNEFEKNNVLFMEDSNWPQKLFKILLKNYK